MPSMTWDYPSLLGEEQHGGFFCHFNNFRHTKHVMKKDKSFKPVEGDYRLKNFTLMVLDAIVGVKLSCDDKIGRSIISRGDIIDNTFSSFYLKTGIEFLKEYGRIYDLFQMFTLHPNQPDGLSYLPENMFVKKKISDQYLLRNYSSYSRWELLASVDADPKYFSYSDRYLLSEGRLVRYNNRFRFGPGMKERFHTIFFHKDPWRDKDSSVMFGTYPYDHPVMSDCYCQFNTPLPIDVVMEFDQSIHSCKIPLVIRNSLTNNINHISLHLIQKTSNGVKVLLSNITVHRLYPLDRRSFNVSVCTMIDDINNFGIVEWLVHNLALGVEHFYIFDNRKIYSDANTSLDSLEIENSVLKPFLDANLITLIYYPFCQDKERYWNTIQSATFEVFLQQFGHYSKWVGLYDIDEFFVASPDMVESFLFNRKIDGQAVNLIGELLTALENSKKAKHIKPGYLIGIKC